ncbi:uncharacterized protein LOC111408527 isoform X3 [Olea europaea var. sylvestris]|uniref:uncharacterized protein LOC111408527 isoform X3 n=1 Tax=Olea europaea var. sylvestris TaxID=158386 RepID=UPI000C1D21BA|nr:uncharacterized protein LOC111408527 isoform X3 [Olea europaea var. sylvestris]
MCLRIAGEKYFLKVVTSNCPDRAPFFSQHRCLILDNMSPPMNSLASGLHVRPLYFYSERQPFNLCGIKVLRVLDFQGSCECVVGIERLVHLRSGTYFSESCRQQATKDDRFQINSNLQNVSALTIHDETDEKILRCLHNLRRLTIWFESSLDYSSDFVNQLESLKLIKVGHSSSILISVPLYLKQLTLVKVRMSSKEMEIIEGLLNLEVLKFLDVSF